MLQFVWFWVGGWDDKDLMYSIKQQKCTHLETSKGWGASWKRYSRVDMYVFSLFCWIMQQHWPLLHSCPLIFRRNHWIASKYMSNVQVPSIEPTFVSHSYNMYLAASLSVHAAVSQCTNQQTHHHNPDSSQCSCLVILWQQNIVISVFGHLGIITRTPTLTSSSLLLRRHWYYILSCYFCRLCYWLYCILWYCDVTRNKTPARSPSQCQQRRGWVSVSVSHCRGQHQLPEIGAPTCLMW